MCSLRTTLSAQSPAPPAPPPDPSRHYQAWCNQCFPKAVVGPCARVGDDLRAADRWTVLPRVGSGRPRTLGGRRGDSDCGRRAPMRAGNGHAALEAPGEAEGISGLDRLLDLALQHMNGFRRAGAQEGVVHVDCAYDKQCNLEYEPETLSKLAQLGFALTLTCYRDESEFEQEAGTASP
jgi:hypothetical protein